MLKFKRKFIFSCRTVYACLLFSAIFFSYLPLQAQLKPAKKKKSFYLETLYSAGKVLPIYAHFPTTTFSNAAALSFGCQTWGKEQWNKLFNYPRLGVSLIYQNLGNNRVMGQQLSVVPTVYFSTTQKENTKVFGEIRYGLGLAYFNRPYDSISNPGNAAAGEHFMWQFTIGADLHWKMSRYFSLVVGGLWYHASDSHTQLPNAGVNTFAAYAGILLFPFGRQSRIHTYDTVGIEHQWHFNARLGSGYQEKGGAFGPIGGPKYPVYTIAAYASKRVAKIFLLKAGLTYRYYPMYQSYISDTIFHSHLAFQSSAFVLMIGTEFLIGHFAISLETGINLYKPAFSSFWYKYEPSSKWNYYTESYIANRLGANYYIFNPYTHLRNNVFIGAYVSANFGEAEFLELNVGYVF